MSRRTPDLPRRPREFWPTPAAAVLPLLRHLPAVPCSYVEPMAGDGALVRALAEHWPVGTCALASDIHPEAAWIEPFDAMDLQAVAADLIITNPPWPKRGTRGRPVLEMAWHLSALAPTWFLLDHGFAAAQYFGSVWDYCRIVQPVGRVSWLGNGRNGYEDCAWFLFDQTGRHTGMPVLYPQPEVAS